MVMIPILRWEFGDGILPWGASVTVVLLALATLALLYQAWGGARVLRTAGMLVAGAWCLEFLGVSTGFPFGLYDYTKILWPQIGSVPVIIPLAWLMLLPPAWAIAALLTKYRRVQFILVAAAAFTVWDLFLDPQMVSWGFWIWHAHGGYFGIPWTNFLGWFCGAALLTWLVHPDALPLHPLWLIYALTWLLQSIGLLAFWGMPGPGLAGFVGMGVFAVAAFKFLPITRLPKQTAGLA